VSAPAFGSIGTLHQTSTSTPSFAVPASVAAGDIIIVAAYIDGTATVTGMPSGFAHAENSPKQVAPGGAGTHSLVVMWKRATGADSGTYAFTLDAAQFVFGNAVRYTGCVASGNPWDTAGSGAVSEGGNVVVSSPPTVSLTTAGPDRMLVYVATDNNGDGGTWSPPAGYNQRQGGASVTCHEISDLVQSAAGSTGGQAASNTLGGRMGGWIGALIGTTSAAAEQNTAPQQLPPALLFELVGRQQLLFNMVPGVQPTVEQGRTTIALGGSGAATKKAVQTGSAALAGTSTGTARKTAAVSGSAVVGLRGQTAATKTGSAAGRALLALIGSGVESTADTRAQTGRALVALVGVSAARKTGVPAGRALVALTGTGAAVKRAAAAATAAVALSGTGAARKTGSVAGRALLALSGTGVEATGSARLQTGTATLGLGASAAAVRRALPVGSALVELRAGATARKTATAAGRATTVLATGATAAKRATPTGRTMLAALPYEIVPAPVNPPGAAFVLPGDRATASMLGADRAAGWSTGSRPNGRLGGRSSGGP